MAKQRKWGRGNVPVQETRNAQPVVTSSDPTLAAPPIPVKPPLVFFPPGPELRAAHREILALRALQLPIPEYLSINDNIMQCGNKAVRRLKAIMIDAGVNDINRVREFTSIAIPD